MKTYTGTITHEPKLIGKDCYALTMIAESGTPYLLTVNELTRDNMQLKRGRTVKATGAAYESPTTGIAEINLQNLRVLPKRCPSNGRRPKQKRTPRRKGPSRKQCAAQAAFAI